MKPKKSIIPVFIPHLGCPCRCVFCNQDSITSVKCSENGKSMPTPDEVAGIIERGVEVSGKGAEVAFYGGSFTAISMSLQRAYLEVAHKYVSDNLLSGIRVSTRPDAIDGDILSELRRFGVSTIELGAQSMEDKVLLLSRRGHTAADTVRASRLIRDMNFSLILQMMVGLPGETPDSPMYTAGQIADLQPEGVRIYPTAILKETELEEMWRRGEYPPLELSEAVNICTDLIVFFEERDIAVLRVGLNPSEDLDSEVLAGVYHPAFGDLCRSELVFRTTRRMLSDALDNEHGAHGRTAVFCVADSQRSLFVGQHRSNIRRLIEVFQLEGICICNKHRISATNYSVHKHNTNKVITTKSKVNIRDIINREQSLATNTENPADEQVCVELLGIF